MRSSPFLICSMAVVVTSLVSRAQAETVQTGANVFDDRAFLWVEAESYASLGDDPENDGWSVVSKESPIDSVPYSDAATRPILPADSNVSGTALLDDIGGGGHTDTAVYEVKFITAGAYQLYTRHSMYDSGANNNFDNEDSIYMSPAFNKNSESDWLGFEGSAFDESDINVDPPTPGEAPDPDGWKPATADSTNDGWYATKDWGVKSEGVVTFPNNALSNEWNGHFNWYGRPFFVGANPAGSFDSDSEFRTQYIVTEEMVGQTLTFELGTREAYVVIDGFLFIEDDNFDLLVGNSQADLDEGILVSQALAGDYNNDGSVDAADYTAWRDNVGAAAGTLPNDVAGGVIGAAQYDTWVANFGNPGSAGGAAIPEPSTVGLLLVGLGLLVARLRR